MIYDIFRCIGMLLAWPLQLAFFKRKTYYEDKKEQNRFIKGGALVVSNHFCVFDYFVNAYLFPFRKLYVVLSEFVFNKNKIFYLLTKFHGGIKADRECKSMSFMDESVEVLENGGLVQIFPEARNTPDGNIHEFKISYVLIALRANVPILPVVTDGNYGFLKRTHVIIGKKIYLTDYCSSLNPTKEQLIMLNGIVEKKVHELRSELDKKVKGIN
ncbi:MAG: 1-acyl-sn-glycerol-3-phosphate acyltransferase [Clostridia bacterium]|nr:1-acyl-sn-glycerol-3-phosphate acyltransferase [Clostridia bacterium]